MTRRAPRRRAAPRRRSRKPSLTAAIVVGALGLAVAALTLGGGEPPRTVTAGAAVVAAVPPPAKAPVAKAPAARPPRVETPPVVMELPAWQRHAVPATPPQGWPMVAVVIDDVGVNRAGARDAIALPAPMTLSFMTYADDLPAQTAAARAAGHELLVHMPMEPSGAGTDPGPNALLRGLDPAEIERRLDWGLRQFDGYVGINNHMGSAFTADPEGMAVVLRALDGRGLLFLDSRTTAATVAPAIARDIGLPFLERDVFLDNDATASAVARQLDKLEKAALRDGTAIGIGHPHPATLAALRAWAPGLAARGIALVPLTAILKARMPPVVTSGGGRAGKPG